MPNYSYSPSLFCEHAMTTMLPPGILNVSGDWPFVTINFVVFYKVAPLQF